MDDQSGRGAIGLLASLVGTWRGRGTLALPSKAPREFEEEVRFTVRSPASLDYWQRATDVMDGSMLHSESGIWRVTKADTFELSVALPGAAEVSEGVIDGVAVVLASTAVARAETGVGLVATARRYELRGNTMAYEIGIKTEGFAMPGHIKGDLHRTI